MSHRSQDPICQGQRTGRRDHRHPKTNATVSQVSRMEVPEIESSASSRFPISLASSTAAGRHSINLTNLDAAMGPTQVRPSGIPRSTSARSSMRLDAIASPRLSSSLSSANKLRAAKPAQSHQSDAHRDIGHHYQRPGDFESGKPTILGVTAAHRTKTAAESSIGTGPPSSMRPSRPSVVTASTAELQYTTQLPPGLIPELQALAAASAMITPVQAPSLSSISSPSPLFTDSPGTRSSRNTTPTSISSYSPGIVPPLQMNHAGKHFNSAPISAASKTKFPRLPVLQESTHSSSSSVIANETRVPNTKATTKKKRGPISSPAPSPPPRSSSVKHKTSRRDDDKPIMSRGRPKAPGEEISPLAKRTMPRKDTRRTHNQLLQSRNVQQHGPCRPSREGVSDLNPRRPAAIESTLPSSRRGRSRKHEATSDRAVAVSARQQKTPFTAKPEDGEAKGLSRDCPQPQFRPRQASSKHQPMPVESLGVKRNIAEKTDMPLPEVPNNRLGRLSRFNIFGKHFLQSDHPGETPSKLQRKGPAAGTGHEGYGKFGRRGRKTSTDGVHSSSSSDRSGSSLERLQNRFRSRKNSTSSKRDRTSQSELDDFAAERLRPIAMMGGSRQLDNNGRRALSEFVGHYQSTDLELSHVALASRPDIGSRAWTPEAYSASVSSVGSVSEPVYALESATMSNDILQRNNAAAPVYHTSTNTSQSSMLASVSSISRAPTDMDMVDAHLLKKPDKKGRKLRWNFFQRSSPSSRSLNPPAVTLPSEAQIPVRISEDPIPRSVPYYAVMESDSENNNMENLGEVLSQVVDFPPPLPRKDSKRFAGKADNSHRRSASLPLTTPKSAELHRFSPSRETTQSLGLEGQRTEETKALPSRPRRLAAVGRIPRVISRKGRQTADNAGVTSEAEAADPASTSKTLITQYLERPVPWVDTEIGAKSTISRGRFGQQYGNFTRPAVSAVAQEEGPQREYLRFPFEQTPNVSASISSTGLTSSGTPFNPIFAHSSARQSRHHSGEDEVWNEYDDFIDHVMSPDKPKVSPLTPPALATKTFSASGPLYRPGPQHLACQVTLPEAMSTLSNSSLPEVIQPPPFFSEPDSGEDFLLRRSGIVSAPHSSMDGYSPCSVGELIAEYGNWNRNSGKPSERLSTSTAPKSGFLSPVSSEKQLPSADAVETSQQHNAVLLDVVGRGKNPAAHSELHFASLMVSRWLSFGRVLFSPAHDEICSIPERHVLVLDGLGSVDWSIFCSTVYQNERAFVHDLKERGVGQSAMEPGHSPPNYRRAEVATLAGKFPFPPSFFSVVVIRFPPTMADHKMKNIMQECKRVLSPGGYLELMLLDLDIVNMGVHTRRALRELKTKLAIMDRNINLKPLSDNLQSHLGQQGFLNLSRCVVGVPVVGQASGSTDSSASSRSSHGSYGQPKRASLEAQKTCGQKGVRHSHRHYGHNFSLNDLVADHSENADEKIGKMVSKTARSWWQHCFEAPVIPDGNVSRSTFAERQVLRECKMRGSNFKLLIAHAQKPELENRRRTMSEPLVPTYSTAGLGRTRRAT